MKVFRKCLDLFLDLVANATDETNALPLHVVETPVLDDQILGKGKREKDSSTPQPIEMK